MPYASVLDAPPPDRELRVEKDDEIPGVVDRLVHRLKGLVVRRWTTRVSSLRRLARRAMKRSEALETMTDQRLQAEGREVREELHRRGFSNATLERSLALVREVAFRTVGMRHFESQLMGGIAMLRGMIAEMNTGEGKTLTATLAACTAALAGVPVHVITVNDYLAARDAEELGPVYKFLGLTVGCVQQDQQPPERRLQYDCNVCYLTNKDVVFDYLRDNLALGNVQESLRLRAESLTRASRTQGVVQRGLYFAIVDEADSVLIDEARTPLIIAFPAKEEKEEEFLQTALSLARRMERDVDFIYDPKHRDIKLTEDGVRWLSKRAAELPAEWAGRKRREETVSRALSALHVFKRDEDYIVHEDKVQLIDDFTGRLMPDRAWERGIHQCVELKESVPMTERRETKARMSYQRFFRRYLHLSGMSGTAMEVAGEFWHVYGLGVARIPPNLPSKRQARTDRVHGTLTEKWKDVAARARAMHESGRPTLIGVRSVAASEALSRHLTEAGLEHRVLNAKQDKEEAAIVAQAGQPGSVTVATNMAGRGTDIKLGPGVNEKGGLHVILTERHESHRIDRQLYGRCARQGDRGSYESILSAEDSLIQDSGTGILWAALNRARPLAPAVWSWIVAKAINRLQAALEDEHARVRNELFDLDAKRLKLLTFSRRSD